jgi:hypothetical protein
LWFSFISSASFLKRLHPTAEERRNDIKVKMILKDNFVILILYPKAVKFFKIEGRLTAFAADLVGQFVL